MIEFEKPGVIEYNEAWEYQKKIYSLCYDFRAKGNQKYFQKVILCQHPHVYTLGKNGNKDNLLIDTSFLESIGASFYHVDRGGDITYHGPGQLVGYPILDLNIIKMTIREYIHNLEESVIQTIKAFGIKGERLKNAPGVWIDINNNPRKICAIGIRVKNFITMHGFALNVNTDLNYFQYILPCGFKDKGVTSIKKEINQEIKIDDVISIFEKEFLKKFN